MSDMAQSEGQFARTRKLQWDVVAASGIFIAACLGVGGFMGSVPLNFLGGHDNQNSVIIRQPLIMSMPSAHSGPSLDRRTMAVNAYHQGSALMEEGKYMPAAAEFKIALEKLPSFAEAYAGLAAAMARLDNHRAAELNALHTIDLLKQGNKPVLEGVTTEAILDHAHRVLGQTLLAAAKQSYAQRDAAMARMDANRAAAACAEATSYDRTDRLAQRCTTEAQKLAASL